LIPVVYLFDPKGAFGAKCTLSSSGFLNFVNRQSSHPPLWKTHEVAAPQQRDGLE
jgi:hypothetical protein